MIPAPKPEPKIKKQVKLQTVNSLHRDLWEVFARYIKLRDCLRTTGTKTMGKCISCGKLHDLEDLQAGHFITRRAMSIRYHEKNVHAQCANCNGRLHGNVLHYADAIVRLYGVSSMELLRAQEHSNRPWKKYELQALIVDYQNKVKSLEGKSDSERHERLAKKYGVK